MLAAPCPRALAGWVRDGLRQAMEESRDSGTTLCGIREGTAGGIGGWAGCLRGGRTVAVHAR